MIVTVTPNPSIDRTLMIPPLLRGRLVRATAATAEAGGKGINVARALAAHGHPTVAVAPLSSTSRSAFAALLDGAVELESVPIAGAVRVNVSLVEEDGTVTKVNEPGPSLLAGEVEALLDRVAALAQAADWVVGSGSLPSNAPDDLYARLAVLVPPRTRVAIDADGAALAKSVGPRVALLKPNLAELETVVGQALPTLGDAVDAAAGLVEQGIGGILVSLGPDGAMYIDRDGATHAEARITDVENTVGAGDALLAGFLAAGGDGPEALAEGVAWGAAACVLPGTAVPGPADLQRDLVQTHSVDPERPLGLGEDRRRRSTRA